MPFKLRFTQSGANATEDDMAEVIKDLEDQFTTICDAAKEVSGLLEAGRAQYTSSFNDHSGEFMNNVAIFLCLMTSLINMKSFFMCVCSQENAESSSVVPLGFIKIFLVKILDHFFWWFKRERV